MKILFSSKLLIYPIMKICNIMPSINNVIKIIKKEKIDNKFCFVDSLLLQLFKKRNISFRNNSLFSS